MHRPVLRDGDRPRDLHCGAAMRRWGTLLLILVLARSAVYATVPVVNPVAACDPIADTGTTTDSIFANCSVQAGETIVFGVGMADPAIQSIMCEDDAAGSSNIWHKEIDATIGVTNVRLDRKS